MAVAPSPPGTLAALAQVLWHAMQQGAMHDTRSMQMANETMMQVDSNQQEVVDCKAQISLVSHKTDILEVRGRASGRD